jgi:hypothetical protein
LGHPDRGDPGAARGGPSTQAFGHHREFVVAFAENDPRNAIGLRVVGDSLAEPLPDLVEQRR